MAATTHRIFLIWLIYATLVAFGLAAAVATGLASLILAHDHAHLSAAMVLLFLLAEGLAGRQAFRISAEHRAVTEARRFWDRCRPGTPRMERGPSGDVLVMAEGYGAHAVPKGALASHLRAITRVAEAGTRPEQTLLLDLAAEGLHRRASIPEFFAARIVWVGILGTVLGVVMAFWPFMAAGSDIDRMRGHLGSFFAGIAVAFIPTALSFVLKIALDLSNRILTDGADAVLEAMARFTETRVLPQLSGSETA